MVSKTTGSALMKLASQISYARTILRLFDDIPMLTYNLHCMKSRFEPITCNLSLDSPIQFKCKIEH